MSSTFFRPETIDRVAAALPMDRGLPPRAIAAKVDDLAATSVRQALLALVRSGRAVAEGDAGHRLYRRADGEPVR